MRVWDISGLRKKTVSPGGEDVLRLPQVQHCRRDVIEDDIYLSLLVSVICRMARNSVQKRMHMILTWQLADEL